jgi:hypothetical protein
LTFANFEQLMSQLGYVARAVGRQIAGSSAGTKS